MPATAEAGVMAAALVASAIGVLFSLYLRAWLSRQRRSPAVDGPPDPGPEPPAIVNLLTSRCRTTREAAGATVLDLADRGVLSIDQVGLERSIVGVRAVDDGDLAPYEQLVYDALAAKAVNGELPSDAGSLVAEDLSDRWWRRFEATVAKDAVGRGLVTGVSGSAWRVVILLFLFVPPVLAFAAYGGDLERALATPWSTLLALVTVVPGVVLVAGMLPGPVLTASGRTAAGRWLGARERLAEGEFGPHGPAGVRVWGRHLANAAAMGLAPEVVRALPFGTEDPRRAWSSSGGAWRQVEIRYGRWRPGWGHRPSTTLLLTVLVTAISTGLSLVLHEVEGAAIAEPVAVALAVLAGGGVALALACVVDLVTERHVDGEVIRLVFHRVPADAGLIESLQGSGWFLVVDDGRSSTLPAWEVDEEDATQLAVGQRLRVEVTPCLGYVVGYEPLG